MANAGPDTNKSQVRDPGLDGADRCSSSSRTPSSRISTASTRSSGGARIEPHPPADSSSVIDGLDTTLDAMERVPVGAKNRPVREIRLERVIMHANPLADRDD